MKSAITVLLVLGLLGGPIVCLAAVCPAMQEVDDCCPQPTSLAACPYDILSTAKAAQEPQKQTVSTLALVSQPIASVVQQHALFSPEVSALPDGHDLHLQIRVLRI